MGFKGCKNTQNGLQLAFSLLSREIWKKIEMWEISEKYFPGKISQKYLPSLLQKNISLHFGISCFRCFSIYLKIT